MSKKHEKVAKWRKDFPVDWARDNYVTRRELTKFLVLASGAMCLGNGYVAVQEHEKRNETYPTVPIAHVDELSVGAVKQFRYPTENDPAILIRLADDDYVAYTQRCTHLSCPVQYNHDGARLECPCHNGSFDAKEGKVLGGPPPRPLPRIALRIENGSIIAHGIEVEG